MTPSRSGANARLHAPVRVVEHYQGWEPRLPAKRIVERLLAGVPSKYLSGISHVSLTNTGALNHRDRLRKVRRRGRKVRVSGALGYYRARWHGRGAHIELLVDNIERSGRPLPGVVFRVPLLADYLVGSTLFHEIGHHIHATQRPEHRDAEEVADR